MGERFTSQKVIQMFALIILSITLLGKANGQTTDPVDQEVLASFYSSLTAGVRTWNTNNDACQYGASVGWLTCTGTSDLKASVINLQAGGTIPTTLGLLTQLTSLTLSPYDGTIATEIGSFSGTIPTQLGSLSNLQDLQLSDNELTGPIPTQFLLLTDLQSLILASNQLTGSIPQFSSLSVLDLTQNCFWDVPNYGSYASSTDYSGYTTSSSCTCVGGQTVSTGCSCYSGFTGTTCSNNVGASSLSPVNALTTESVAEFQLSQSYIANGTLFFVITSPGRSLRYFQWIALLGNSSVPVTSSCGYPGTNVTRSFNSTGSSDTFQGQISLSTLSTTCQFQETIGTGYDELNGVISVSAIDPIGQFRGLTIQRTTTSNLKIKLKIPTYLNVTTSTMQIYSPFNLLAAVTEQTFDARIPYATIVITTSVQWPYTLTNSTLISIPSTITPSGTVAVALNISSCSNTTVGSDCLQTSILTIANACQFSGLFSIDWNYGCRAVGWQTCAELGVTNSSIANTNVTLVSDDGCTVIEVDAQLEGTLTTYQDAGYTTQSLTFIAGNTIYFKAHFTASVNIQSLQVLTITATNATTTTVLVAGGTQQLSSLHYNSTVGTPASTDSQFSFVLSYGSGPSYLFQSSSEEVQTVTVVASIQVTYATTFGRKRDVLHETMALTATLVSYRMD